MDDERFETPAIKVKETPWKAYKKFHSYDPSFPKILYEMLTDGKTIAQVARHLDTSKPNLLKWVEEIEDMQEAYEFGMSNFEACFEDKIEKYMIHDDPDTAPPKINKEFMELYSKTNIKKFADLADKKEQNVNVNVSNTGLSESDVINKITNIMDSVESIKQAELNKEKLNMIMSNKVSTNDIITIEDGVTEIN